MADNLIDICIRWHKNFQYFLLQSVFGQFCWVLRVFVMWQGEPTSHLLQLASWYFATFIFFIPVPAAKKRDMMLPPPSFTVGMVFMGWWAVLVLSACLILSPKSSILGLSDHDVFFCLALELSRHVLAKLSWDLMWPFFRSIFFLATLTSKATFVEHLCNCCHVQTMITLYHEFL